MPFSVHVPDRHATVVERLGRHHRTLPAGRHRLVPGLDRVVRRVDLRRQERRVPSFSAIDGDGDTLALGLVLAWTVTDPVAATYEVTDLGTALEQLAVTTVRHGVADLTGAEVDASVHRFADDLRVLLDRAATPWGIRVEAVELHRASGTDR